MTDQPDRTGFKERTRLADARERLRAAVDPQGRTERVPLQSADGRVLAAPVEARRAVPHFEKAVVDGFAVRAADTFGANERSPATLRVVEEGGAVGDGDAARVDAGSPVTDGADAVVPAAAADHRADEGDGGVVEVVDPVAAGDNVAGVGADVAAGQHCFDAGHRLRPSDLGLCRAVGLTEVAVAGRPTVAVVPTGDELVEGDPGPGELVDTSGLTVPALVERWGGEPVRRDPVGDYRAAVRSAVEADLTSDVVVTTGGVSGGERDVVPQVVDGLGEVLVHGVAVEPGRAVGFGVVRDTPVVMLPGAPVAAVVGAVQLLRPLLAWLAGAEPAPLPAEALTLSRKIPSRPGVRTFARVEVEESMGGERRVTPVATGGADALSTVALADGWVEVPESREGVPSGETVRVQDWEVSR